MTAMAARPARRRLLHWSRIVDLALIPLLKFFGLFLAPEQAERAARIAFRPWFSASCCPAAPGRRGFSPAPSARLFGVFAILLCGVMFWQFPPGRIDHHAPQITLLFFAVAALARAFDPARGALGGAGRRLHGGLAGHRPRKPAVFRLLVAATPGLALRPGAAPRRAHAGAPSPPGSALTLRRGVPADGRAAAAGSFPPATPCRRPLAPALVGALRPMACCPSLGGRWPRFGASPLLALAGAAALAPLVAFWPDCLQSPYAGGRSVC